MSLVRIIAAVLPAELAELLEHHGHQVQHVTTAPTHRRRSKVCEARR